MTRAGLVTAAAAATIWASCALVTPTHSAAPVRAGAAPTADPMAIATVRRYVEALAKPDPTAAYALLTGAQQRYFGNARNFGSNDTTTGYRIDSYSIVAITARDPRLVQVDVLETISFDDIASAHRATATVTEPYFALRDATRWGVKELVQPWKSYAPRASGSAVGVTVVVDRVEFFDRRLQVDCTVRNLGKTPVQVLPLLRSTLTLSPGGAAGALNTPDFPLNDRQFFEGARIYPGHQIVGFINFPLPSREDVRRTARLSLGPVIPDGANAPSMVAVGPIDLPKL